MSNCYTQPFGKAFKQLESATGNTYEHLYLLVFLKITLSNLPQSAVKPQNLNELRGVNNGNHSGTNRKETQRV